MRRVLVALVVTTSALSLASCAAGKGAETAKTAQVTDGVEKRITAGNVDIKVTNLTLVATENGDAVLVAAIANRGSESDELLGIGIDGIKATVTGLTTLDQNKPIFFEGDVANAKAVFPASNLVPGTRVPVSIGFAKAGLHSFNVIVRDKSDIYANVNP